MRIVDFEHVEDFDEEAAREELMALPVELAKGVWKRWSSQVYHVVMNSRHGPVYIVCGLLQVVSVAASHNRKMNGTSTQSNRSRRNN